MQNNLEKYNSAGNDHLRLRETKKITLLIFITMEVTTLHKRQLQFQHLKNASSFFTGGKSSLRSATLKSSGLQKSDLPLKHKKIPVCKTVKLRRNHSDNDLLFIVNSMTEDSQ